MGAPARFDLEPRFCRSCQTPALLHPELASVHGRPVQALPTNGPQVSGGQKRGRAAHRSATMCLRGRVKPKHREALLVAWCIFSPNNIFFQVGKEKVGTLC